MSNRVRTTISLDPEVLEVFQMLAEVGGTSVSRCMGDWLYSTVDGAQLVARRVQAIRQTPGELLREHGFPVGEYGESSGVLAGSAKADPPGRHRGPISPPPVIRGESPPLKRRK